MPDMCEAEDKYLELFEKHRELLIRAFTEPISPAEQEVVNAVLGELKAMEAGLPGRVESVLPNHMDALAYREATAREAAEIYEAHYRGKAELDRRLFGR